MLSSFCYYYTVRVTLILQDNLGEDGQWPASVRAGGTRDRVSELFLISLFRLYIYTTRRKSLLRAALWTFSVLTDIIARYYYFVCEEEKPGDRVTIVFATDK